MKPRRRYIHVLRNLLDDVRADYWPGDEVFYSAPDGSITFLGKVSTDGKVVLTGGTE